MKSIIMPMVEPDHVHIHIHHLTLTLTRTSTIIHMVTVDMTIRLMAIIMNV